MGLSRMKGWPVSGNFFFVYIPLRSLGSFVGRYLVRLTPPPPIGLGIELYL